MRQRDQKKQFAAMLTHDGPGTQKSVKLSIERIIELVKGIRNDLVHDFLAGENLRKYFAEQYGTAPSKVKEEFIRRDLNTLAASPLDLPHYASLLREMQEQNSASLSQNNHELFYKELESIFRKYNY